MDKGGVGLEKPPDPIYMDHNATTPVGAVVSGVMRSAMEEDYGNPSSVHRAGRAARGLVDGARKQVADLVGAHPRGVYFTGSASEANNWVYEWHGSDCSTTIYSMIEHSSMSTPAEVDPVRSELVACPGGRLDLEGFERVVHRVVLKDSGYRGLITVMLANNETGVIQPIKEAVTLVRKRASGAWFHVDAVQAAGKIPVDIEALGCDSISLSAHKLYGPKGVGALVMRDPTRKPLPMFCGGHQEFGTRAGTENVPGIAGFGAAADMAHAYVVGAAGRTGPAYMKRMRDLFEDRVCGMEGVRINGRGHPRLPNTSSVFFEGVSAEAMVYYLDEKGVYASAGSACTSGTAHASKVMEASFGEEIAKGTVRFSVGRGTQEVEIMRAADRVRGCVRRLRGTL